MYIYMYVYVFLPQRFLRRDSAILPFYLCFTMTDPIQFNFIRVTCVDSNQVFVKLALQSVLTCAFRLLDSKDHLLRVDFSLHQAVQSLADTDQSALADFVWMWREPAFF